MASEIKEIAAKVVTVLNGHSFAFAVANPLGARLAWLPVYRLQDLDTLKVTVVRHALGGAIADRGRSREMGYEVQIGFQQRFATPVDTAALAAVDQLEELIEEVGDFLFNMDRLPGLQATPVALVNDPVYDPDRLDETGQFQSVLTVTYRVYR